MSENVEIPTASPEEFVNKKELDLAVKTAVVEIQKNEADPVAKTGTAAAELGMMAAIGEAAKTYFKDQAGVLWKDTKVGVMSFLGIVPLAKELGAPAKAMRAANKAAYFSEKAANAIVNTKNKTTNLFAITSATEHWQHEQQILKKAVEAIPKNSDAAKRAASVLAENPEAFRAALQVAERGLPPKNMVDKGVQWLKHSFIKEIPKYIDPFPDVPEGVKKVTRVLDTISFGSSLVALFPPATPVAVIVAATTGIIGTGVPAAWQYMHNRFETMQVGFKYGKEVAGIVSRTVAKKLHGEKSPETQKAASAFATVPAETI